MDGWYCPCEWVDDALCHDGTGWVCADDCDYSFDDVDDDMQDWRGWNIDSHAQEAVFDRYGAIHGGGDVNDAPTLGECPVARGDTPYDYGYTFIEGFMPTESFDALVRPERRLVLVVGGTPVAVDAAEVERAGSVGRPLVTPLGSCSLGPVDIERAHEVDESLYEREGLRRFLTTAPLNAAIETAAAPALGAAEAAGGGVLGGLLAALL